MTSTLENLRTELGDRYQVEREIGAGGMATVYLAQDLKHGRPVAIKVLREELAEAMGAARFRREIEIAASLHHPHILPLFDSGDAGGLLYFVMPFEDGETLRTRMQREGQLPVPAATRLMRDIADALAHAHARGVVHRDIKPENVLCSGQHALVTDFGIAKALAGGQRPEDPGDSSDAATSLTMVGTSLGTPAYMAPEQVAGDPGTDHRADIYALGIVIYEALAGSPPFTGSSTQQVLAAHLAQAPEPVSTLRPDTPPALAAIVMRCLEKEPAARWQSAADLVTAVEALEGSGSAASPRKRWPWLAAAAAVILLVGGGVWVQAEGRMGTLIGNDVLAADDQVMVAEFSNRTADSTLAETVTDAIRIEMQQSPVVRIISQSDMWDGMRAMTLEPGTPLPDPQVRELAERLGVKAFVVGEVASLAGGYQLTARVLATVDGAEALTVRTTAANDGELIAALGELGEKLRRGIGESIRSVAAAPPLARVTTASLSALRAYTAAGRSESDGQRSRAITLYEEAVALDSTFTPAWQGLAIAHLNSGDWPAGMHASSEAYRWRESLSEFGRLNIEALYHELRGEVDQAAAIYRRFTELYNSSWTNYSNTLLALGKLAEAEVVARRGIEKEPEEPVGYWNLVEAQVAQQKYEAADSTIALLRANLPGNRWALFIPASVVRSRRNVDSVLAYFREGPGQDLPVQAEALGCFYELVRGKLRAFQVCGRDGFADRTGLILAEMRMTGDTSVARERIRRVAATGVDTTAEFDMPMLIAAQAEVGDLAAARQSLVAWRASVGPDHPVYRANSGLARGSIALAEQKFDSAATRFLEWNRTPSITATHWYNRGLAEAGAALDRAGNPDSALVLYEKALSMPSITDGDFYEVLWYPQVVRRLGELYEVRGDRGKAIEYYGLLVDQWKDADPVLQPQVQAVRARIAALAGEG